MCKKVVIIGGGGSGCAAALTAKKAGADVTLLEKTDLLLGLGNVGGIMRNNGRFTAAEENIALGAGELFEITDRCSRHINLDFPGHKHASLYDVMKVEPEVRRLLRRKGIDIRFMTRAIDVVMRSSENHAKDTARIEKLILAGGGEIKADVFIETTGSTQPCRQTTENRTSLEITWMEQRAMCGDHRLYENRYRLQLDKIHSSM